MGTPLGPKYILYSYMDPLGIGTSHFGRPHIAQCHPKAFIQENQGRRFHPLVLQVWGECGALGAWGRCRSKGGAVCLKS